MASKGGMAANRPSLCLSPLDLKSLATSLLLVSGLSSMRLFDVYPSGGRGSLARAVPALQKIQHVVQTDLRHEVDLLLACSLNEFRVQSLPRSLVGVFEHLLWDLVVFLHHLEVASVNPHTAIARCSHSAMDSLPPERITGRSVMSRTNSLPPERITGWSIRSCMSSLSPERIPGWSMVS